MYKKHEGLQDELVESVEDFDEEIEEGHNPETAPHDAVKAVAAGSAKTTKQPLRKGDKQNSEAMQRAGAKVREVIMAKEDVDLSDFTLEELEDFMMSEDFEQLDELSKGTLKSYMSKVQGSGKGSMHDIGKKYGKAGSKGDTKGQEKHLNKATTRAAGMGRAFDRLNKEDFEGAFDEDLAALVESEATLSEGFKEKAEVIFEAALSSKLSEHVERLEEQYETQLAEETQRIQEELVEKVDGYLNYVVESWMEENKLAVQNGLRTEIAESFMQALHGVFTEHYISVPDEKADLVDGLADKIEELEEQLNKAVQDNIDLSESVKSYARESVIREAAKDLSEAQAEKLKSLVEDIAFDSEETFTRKVDTIKESYFKKASVQTKSEEEQITEDTKQVEVSPLMQQYLAALKK
jgi:methylphosphotriester-DNA--protein-cysteine methyltransferase